jgi:hypothetical protein
MRLAIEDAKVESIFQLLLVRAICIGRPLVRSGIFSFFAGYRPERISVGHMCLQLISNSNLTQRANSFPSHFLPIFVHICTHMRPYVPNNSFATPTQSNAPTHFQVISCPDVSICTHMRPFVPTNSYPSQRANSFPIHFPPLRNLIGKRRIQKVFTIPLRSIVKTSGHSISHRNFHATASFRGRARKSTRPRLLIRRSEVHAHAHPHAHPHAHTRG